MGIANRYRGTGESTLASYDWYDIATGTGYKTFYGMDVITGSDTKDLILTTQTIYAHDGYSWNNGATSYDFDIELEVPLTIEGDAVVVLPISTDNNFAGTNVTITAKIYSVHNGTETQISETAYFTDDPILNDNNRVVTLLCPIALVRIPAGDILRLEVTQTDPPGDGHIRLCHDPKGRALVSGAATQVTSILSMDLPIKI